MNRPIAIVNCRLLTPRGEIPSGVVLIENDLIVAAGPADSMALPADAALLDCEQGEINAGDRDAAGNAVEPGQPAHLVCRNRFGNVAWVMRSGVIVFPPNAAPPPEPLSWLQRRQTAIEIVISYLKQRRESIHIQNTSALHGFQKKGVDILWRFKAEGAEAQSLSIRVIPSLDDHSGSVFILDGKSARKLPEAGLSATRAHWWFYLHGPDNVIYCFPTTALKKWMDRQAKEIPPTPVRAAGVAFQLSGRAIPIERLQNDIKKTRIIRL